MKRKGFHAMKLATATAVVAALAVPVLAHGMNGDGWSGGGQMMQGQGGGHGGGQGGGMMGGQGGGMMGGQGGGMMGMMRGMMGGGMMGGMMGGGGMGGGMAMMVEKFDADGDGKLTPEEFRTGLKAQLEKYDADGNGSLSLEEFEVLHSDMMRERMVDKFQFLDDDGDGQVTGEEIEKPARMFERMQKMRKKMHEQRERRQGMKQGMKQGGPGKNMMQGQGMMQQGQGMMQGQKKMMQDDN